MNRNTIEKLSDFFFDSYLGSIITSIIIALGIVSIIRKSCTKNKCFTIRAPDPDMVAKTTWRAGDKCFKFDPRPIVCPVDDNKKDNIINRNYSYD